MKKIEEIIEFLLNKEKNVLITGPAGTGKTYLLNKIINILEEKKINFGKTSTTGVSALLFNGQTIHSFLGTGIFDNKNQLNLIKSNFNFKNSKRKLKKLKVIVIDEISMISSNYLELIDSLLKEITGKYELDFGGIKILASGDFLQLPPVNKTKKEIKQIFESELIKNFKIFNLTKPQRQTNKEFFENLNKIRIGEIDEDLLKYFSNLEKKSFNNKKIPLKVMPTNREVDFINNSHLNEIDEKEYVFVANIFGEKESEKDKIKRDVIAQEILKLKKGARVIGLNNEKNGEYVNGSLGIVKDFKNDKVIVEWDNGNISVVEKYEWIRYDQKSKLKLSSFEQIPLKLAYAITIHKTQGMSIDSILIDCKNIFAEGQLYVALSRVKNVEGLYLKNFDLSKIKTNKKAKQFYDSLI